MDAVWEFWGSLGGVDKEIFWGFDPYRWVVTNISFSLDPEEAESSSET
jgi:hypothetical protein